MLEGYFLDLAWLLGALFFGVMLGSLTGLIPGFHVNNVALILLALSPALLDLGIPLASVAAIIVSTGTVHTFLNYIPSALIGAPDGDTALSLLPGHRMLLSGNAARCGLVCTRITTRPLSLPSPHRLGTHRLWTGTRLVRQPALSPSLCAVDHFLPFTRYRNHTFGLADVDAEVDRWTPWPGFTVCGIPRCNGLLLAGWTLRMGRVYSACTLTHRHARR